MGKSGKPVQSIERSASLLEIIAQEGGGAGGPALKSAWCSYQWRGNQV
ncbi:hypothetical protein [Gluconobacter thailandicus]|nr:hypothetical protein [Gluconobacter thailandicus]